MRIARRHQGELLLMAPAAARRLPLAEAEDRPQGDFAGTLRRHGLGALARERVTTLQVNVGRLCNLSCHHCHVEAGPKRQEILPARVAERILTVLAANPSVEVLDLTGGAPELNPSFRRLVSEAQKLGRHVIDRCNLTVLLEPTMTDLPEFFAAEAVHVVASLPCYGPENVEKQRGRGVFDKSLAVLRRLNALGYGRAGSGLRLDLVYNPVGPFLPPLQATLEAKYREELARRFGIAFDGLLTITNMPIRRFARALERAGQLEEYMSLLVNHFNPTTVPGLMCRSLVSVGWDGRLYDCDFNQMLDIPLGGAGGRRARTIWEIESLGSLEGAAIATASHCFGCAAGSGSSCSGALQ